MKRHGPLGDRQDSRDLLDRLSERGEGEAFVLPRAQAVYRAGLIFGGDRGVQPARDDARDRIVRERGEELALRKRGENLALRIKPGTILDEADRAPLTARAVHRLRHAGRKSER